MGTTQTAALEAAAMRKTTARLVPFPISNCTPALLGRVNPGFAALQMNHDADSTLARLGLNAEWMPNVLTPSLLNSDGINAPAAHASGSRVRGWTGPRHRRPSRGTEPQHARIAQHNRGRG